MDRGVAVWETEDVAKDEAKDGAIKTISTLGSSSLGSNMDNSNIMSSSSKNSGSPVRRHLPTHLSISGT